MQHGSIGQPLREIRSFPEQLTRILIFIPNMAAQRQHLPSEALLINSLPVLKSLLHPLHMPIGLLRLISVFICRTL